MARGSRIKGITIELDANITPLQKALSNVDKSLKNTQASLKDVNKLLKLDPSNTDLLKQKQELLKQSIDDTKDRLKTLNEAYRQLDGQGTEEAKQQQQMLAREISETESNLKSLKDQYRDFVRNADCALSQKRSDCERNPFARDEKCRVGGEWRRRLFGRSRSSCFESFAIE